ncbi:iron-regulated protein [Elizabethkingia argentiflava]|uniref:Iron-regulated protein n=1 Tax=Elizabethkingia argenteiflava TaxID=2681556 RepID=A0A845PU83_9FLAO|nr:ChaN family lipoprotein [Elizabethkingia argenteiflava]NAW50581.1 iron-regulated protein [Elizabethkingia argenteiflava]
MKKLFLLIALSVFCPFFSQQFKAYQFYNKKGKPIKSEKMIKQLANYQVVLFGELHNNAIVHWLQLKLTQALYKKNNKQITLGGEMFERDNQYQLDQYLAGRFPSSALGDSVRLWPNYTTDYKPLLDFAKNHQLKFIATNIPRKYASQVAKKGLDYLENLSVEEKAYMVKLPIKITMDTPGYQEMKTLFEKHDAHFNVTNFIAAQAIKDASMAESIFKNLKPGYLFIHYNGNYHTQAYGGIFWYIKQMYPNLKVAVISVFESENPKLPIPKTDYIPTDFNLIIPTDMAKTY